MNHDPNLYEDQIILFYLGVLKGYELRALEEHLSEGCADCEKILAENEAVFSNLPYALEDRPVPESIEDKIFEAIESSESAVREKPAFDFWRTINPLWLNLGSAVAIAGIAILIFTNISLRNEMSELRQDLTTLQASLEKENNMMPFVTDPDVESIKLAGTMSELDSSGKLLWEKGAKDALLVVSGVPTLEEGNDYQFWVVEDGVPHSMGTFKVNKDGSYVMEIHCMPEKGGRFEFAVTLEPEGGMPKPTGAKYLSGSI